MSLELLIIVFTKTRYLISTRRIPSQAHQLYSLPLLSFTSIQMVVLPKRLQTFWVCDRVTINFGHLSGANDGFRQGLDLLPVDGHWDLVHAKHKSWNMLAA